MTEVYDQSSNNYADCEDLEVDDNSNNPSFSWDIPGLGWTFGRGDIYSQDGSISVSDYYSGQNLASSTGDDYYDGSNISYNDLLQDYDGTSFVVDVQIQYNEDDGTYVNDDIEFDFVNSDDGGDCGDGGSGGGSGGGGGGGDGSGGGSSSPQIDYYDWNGVAGNSESGPGAEVGSNQAGNAPVYFTLPPGGEFELDTHSGSAAPYTLSVSNVVDWYCPDNQRNPGYYDYNAATDTFTPVNDNGNAYVDDNEIIWYYSENLDLWYAYFTPTDAADGQENAITSGGTTIASFITGTVTKLLASRDTLSNNFANADEVNLNVPIYAGTTTGDMVSWNVDGMDNATHVWWAIGPQGQEVDGPEGTEDGAWIFANGGSDVDNQWLTWNPGQWTIYCSVNYDYTFQFTQDVGWRTEDYLVIGQIVKTTAYYGNRPTWAQTIPYREAMIEDNPWVPTSLLNNTELLALASIPWPMRDYMYSLADLGVWGYTDHSNTPQGPFTATYPLGLGTLSEPQNLWIVESAHNVTVDSPTVSNTIPASTVFPTIGDGQFRLFNRFQTRFLVNDDGTINQESVFNISNVASVGQTKYMVPEGLFLPLWDSPAVGLTDQESETDSDNGFHASSDGTRLSEFVSGRVGFEGQNDIWRFFGHDAPWPFVEIIAELNDDGSVSSYINTSVDITWRDGEVTAGSAPFNNLNILKAVVDEEDNENVNYVLQPAGLQSMAGNLEAFLDMVSFGTWPAPAPSPSVQ